MTVDFATLPLGLTAGGGLARLRALPEPPDPLYHVYIVPEEASEQLAGVVSLRQLALADPAIPLDELMEHEPRTVQPEERPREVAHIMAEFNLPDLPVVDDDGNLLGIILIDDAIDALYPDLWRRRLSQAFR